MKWLIGLHRRVGDENSIIIHSNESSFVIQQGAPVSPEAYRNLGDPMKTLIMIFMVAVAVLFDVSLSAEDQIVDTNSKVVKLSGDFRFTEGPSWDRKGTLYFSDIPNKTIHSWTSKKGIETFKVLEGSCNGLRFDQAGNLFVCQPAGRAIVKITPEGKQSVVADEFEGKKLNSPNDLWIDPNGGIYFTDPRYGSMDDLQQSGFHVYYIHPGEKKIDRILDNLVKPNGVVGSADGKKLYVTDPGAQKTYVYDITGPGKLDNRKLAADAGSDGLELDERGNLYITGDSMRIFNSEAKEIASIPLPERAANMTIGGPDGKTLFITARTGLYSVQLKVRSGSDPFAK